MTEVEIGSGKSARRAYELNDIAIVPSRRTRDPEDVSIAWEIDAYQLELPVLGSASTVASPEHAIALGHAGAAGILDLEGLWTRHEDAADKAAELGSIADAGARLVRERELLAAPIQAELVVQRIREIRDAGVVSAACLRPQKVEEFAPHILKADLELFVIQGRVVSAEHVSKTNEPLNLKRFIREFEIPVIVGGCASYQAALHLMRAGAVGVLAGVRGVPLATTIADAAGARMAHLVETGVYVHVIANGGVTTGSDVTKAIACGADAAVVDAGADGIEEIVSTLRREMASSGHETVREFQKAEVVVAKG